MSQLNRLIRDAETEVAITKDELAKLKRDQAILRALEAGGVDNWEWFSESLREAGFFNEDDD